MKYITSFLLLLSLSSYGEILANDTLKIGFETPPPAAKARTWWHWMNGNVTRRGITADLEAMKEVGIQEAQLFNVNLAFPKGDVTYLSPEWLALFEHAALEAKRLGLELAFHNGAGWSSSGGPWITPENAMQTVVFSEVVLVGGQRFREKLPQPETTLDYYEDIAVMAFPKPTSQTRIDDLDFKILSGRVRNHLMPDTKRIPAAALIDRAAIIDLTPKVEEDGFLDWTPEKGEWVILRMGHTPVGTKNHPAVSGGHGLECDKMSKKAVDAFWKGGIAPIIERLDTLTGSVVNNCLIDSYEVGTANWTAGFNREFERLRRYDCTPFLPTLAGYYVGSGELTERFLWDFRRTIGDLMAENYYGYFGDLCRENGMTFSVEPYWGPFDNMQVGATGDIVMCEFWSGGFPFFDSPKFVSSIAKLNGSSIVGAEAFTGIGGWSTHPAKLKSIGDKAWAQGINRFIFHTYVHQPWEVKPGLALGPYGTDFNRMNTWWKQGKAFTDYIGRSQFLLQQGRSVADVLVFTGESSPNNTMLLPGIKAQGYDYDLIGVNKLALLTVENGKLRTPTGDFYRVLVLPEKDWMRPATLTKIKQLVEAGAVIIGPRPFKSPSLEGYPQCDMEVESLTEQLWGSGLVKDETILDFLRKDTIPEDFTTKEGNTSALSFIHRKTATADIYFIANGLKESRQELCRFRITDKQPELWNAETGQMMNLPVWRENQDGTISIPIHFNPEEALFVIFRKPTKPTAHIEEIATSIKKPRPKPLPGLEIVAAEYGTFLQQGLVDITTIVANRVTSTGLNITADRKLCNCDPAMGYKKELRLEYELNGVTQRMFVSEKEHINIETKGGGELKITKAVFGKFKPETKGVPQYYSTYDVSDKIKRMVVDGKLNLPIDNRLIEGREPAGNHPTLRITYLTNKEERTLYIPKGEVLNLAMNTPEPKLVFDDEKVSWLTPYVGKMTYTTSLGQSHKVEAVRVPDVVELSNDWEVTFPLERGGKEKKTMEKLISWSDFTSDTIRHFSGTTAYRKEFILSEYLFQGDHFLELDLGSVGVIAEVIVNEKNLGILWRPPFRINLEEVVHPGRNKLEIKVTNLWVNRLIGDEFLVSDYGKGKGVGKEWPEWLLNPSERPSKRTTFASFKHWDKEDKLRPSGLLGPVIIRPYVKLPVSGLR